MKSHELNSEEDYDDGHEMAHLNDDVMREQNRSTDAIIATFETLSHGSDEHDPTLRHMSPTFLHRIMHAEPLEDDIYENTDTEDGAYDIIDLIESNGKLIAFVGRQSETIARLRARIARMMT